MAWLSSKFRARTVGALLPLVALCGCAGSGDIRSAAPKLAEFDVPHALFDTYTNEIEMLTTCKVGQVSSIFTFSIDPTFDRDKQTASIALIGTGYFNPETWGTIDLQARGAAITHVRVYATRGPYVTNIGRDAEKWAYKGAKC